MTGDGTVTVDVGDEVVLHLLRPGETEPAEQRRITVAVRR